MVGNCTVMCYEPITGVYFKTRNLVLKSKVKRLEEIRQKEWHLHELSLAEYERVLGLPIRTFHVWPIIEYWFNVKQIGWYHGVPLVTIEMKHREDLN